MLAREPQALGPALRRQHAVARALQSLREERGRVVVVLDDDDDRTAVFVLSLLRPLPGRARRALRLLAARGELR